MLNVWIMPITRYRHRFVEICSDILENCKNVKPEIHCPWADFKKLYKNVPKGWRISLVTTTTTFQAFNTNLS